MAAHNRYNGQPFTCANRRCNTDTTKGKPHGAGQAAGSVFDTPLIPGPGFTLWLEHVRDNTDQKDVFWLMWYDQNGDPTMAGSSIFDADELREMARRFAGLIEIK